MAAIVVACRGSGGPGAYSPEHSEQYMGNKVAPASESEEALLETVGRLVTGRQQRVGELLVVADEPYFAASGRTCRALLIKRKAKGEGQTRLACKDDAQWFFAPSVTGP